MFKQVSGLPIGSLTTHTIAVHSTNAFQQYIFKVFLSLLWPNSCFNRCYQKGSTFFWSYEYVSVPLNVKLFSFLSFFLLSPLICFSRFWFRVPHNHTITVVHQKAFSHRALLKTLIGGFKNQTCIWLLMASAITHWDQYISTLEREIIMGCYHARPSGLSHLWSFFLFHSNPFFERLR